MRGSQYLNPLKATVEEDEYETEMKGDEKGVGEDDDAETLVDCEQDFSEQESGDDGAEYGHMKRKRTIRVLIRSRAFL